MIEERRKKYEKELHEKYLQLYHNEQCYEELMQMQTRLWLLTKDELCSREYMSN